MSPEKRAKVDEVLDRIKANTKKLRDETFKSAFEIQRSLIHEEAIYLRDLEVDQTLRYSRKLRDAGKFIRVFEKSEGKLWVDVIHKERDRLLALLKKLEDAAMEHYREEFPA